MKQTVFQGVATALVTPMQRDGSLDRHRLEELLEYQVRSCVDAVVVAATTGEGSTLTDEEHRQVVRWSADAVRGRVPVIAGVGSNDTAHAVRLCRDACEAGADALLMVTPYYNKTSQKGLVEHFTACARATRLPVILYNVPSRTGMNIQPETCLKLCEEENIVGNKEASGDLSQLARIAALCGDRLDLYSGNDDQVVPALALGAKGVISVLSNLMPGAVHEMCRSFFEGNISLSREIQLHCLELIQALFSDINPIPVKQAFSMMGIPVGPCRLPLCEMEDKAAEKLKSVLKKYRLCVEEQNHVIYRAG